MSNQEYAGSNPALPAKIKCPHCDREFSKMGLGSHIWRVHGDGIDFLPAKGKKPWNKNLTKKTDIRLQEMGDKIKSGFASGEIIAWQKGKSKETDPRIKSQAEQISKTIMNKVKTGKWHNSFSHARRHTYKNESFDGTWEVKLAMWFDKNDIPWIRNKESFEYHFESRLRHYIPDFYLPNIDCYVEVKGWKTSRDEAKWRDFPRRLFVVSGTDLKLLGIDISVRNDWK